MFIFKKDNMLLKYFVALFTASAILACSQKANDKALGVAQLTIDPSAYAITIDDTYEYSAKFIDARGDVLEDIQITWFSSDDGVATVSEIGEVTGISEGQVEIRAEVANSNSGITQSNSVKLTVISNPDAVAMVKILNTQTTFLIDENVQLNIEVSKIDGTKVDQQTTLWKSSDELIATVDESGFVQVLAVGITMITATVDGIESPSYVLIARAENSSRSADFVKAAHNVSGAANLQVNSSGNLELVFSDDFSVDNGPGLEVFLSHSNLPGQTSLNLGSLKSIVGGQTYTISGNVSIDDYDWVIVYCVPYKIVFARSELP